MEEADVVVIGAGFAGLAAAERLAAADRRVILLEASDRVGGRAQTDYALAGGVPLELGAQMVHGRKAVTHTWISREGLHTRHLLITQRSRLVVGRRVASYPWMALPFHPVAGTRAVYDGFVRIPRQIDAAGPPDRSVEEFLSQRQVHPVARLIVSNLYAHVYAADPDAIGVLGPAEEYRVAAEPYGFRNFQLVEGYSALVDRVTARLGNRIRLNCEVTEVHISPTGARVRAAGPAGSPTGTRRSGSSLPFRSASSSRGRSSSTHPSPKRSGRRSRRSPSETSTPSSCGSATGRCAGGWAISGCSGGARPRPTTALA